MQRRGFVGGLGAMGAGLIMPTVTAAAAPLWVPPEESPHQATLMQWPNDRKIYRNAMFLRMVQDTITTIANTISAFEPVYLLAPSELHASIRAVLSGAVSLWSVPTQDLWCRDSGPLIALNDNGQLVVSHIRFNGWGKKQRHAEDTLIASRVARQMGIPVIESGLTGEAGGIEHDGHGLLMAHESSWVIGNRNPGLSRRQIEDRLLRAYGAERLVWSKGLIGHDITDYHIDSLARFTGRGRVLMNLPRIPDPRDRFHQAAWQTHRALNKAGLSLDVIHEPEQRRVKNRDFVASYVNYYVCNGAVIASQFGDEEADSAAKLALERHYPGRKIIMLNTDALGEIGGGIHCATQQIPATP